MNLDRLPSDRAIVYCERAFGTTNGKTAHGLVRRSRRYQVLSVVDSTHAGRDAGDVLDHRPKGIPIAPDVQSAHAAALAEQITPTHLVIGLAPDGGRLPADARADVKRAIELGLNVDSGLHDFLSEDPELVELATRHDVVLRDVRKPPPRSQLHFFTGKIDEVDSLTIAVLGTDSAVGKRTTAWRLVEALENAGYTAEMVGTGQTAWMQGARYGVIMDSLINDFVAGEIEHAVWSAWNERRPDVIVVEGQGSLMNPAYPGGFEILAAARPDVIILQHAPARTEYDGFPGHPLHPVEQQIEALELISGKPVVAVTVNHEHIPLEQVGRVCRELGDRLGLPVIDVLVDGGDGIVEILKNRITVAGGLGQ